MTLATPQYNLEEYPNVYEPREDTFLLLDALELELSYLEKLNPLFVVEIGSGSGIIINAVSSILKNKSTYFATDINIEACKATLDTSKLNTSLVEVLNMDLLSCFKQNLFDLILFNPPYVVTECDEVEGTSLNRSWAGGKQGRLIIDNLIQNLHRLLTDKGVCYMILLKENDPFEVGTLVSNVGLNFELVMERKIIGEHLFVMKFFK